MPKKIIIDNIPIFLINPENQSKFFELDGDNEHWIYRYAAKFEHQLLPGDWQNQDGRLNSLEEEFYLTGIQLITNEGLGARICSDMFLEFGMILDRTIAVKEYTVYKFIHLLMESGSGSEVNIKIV